jgi:hypothetical protein
MRTQNLKHGSTFIALNVGAFQLETLNPAKRIIRDMIHLFLSKLKTNESLV